MSKNYGYRFERIDTHFLWYAVTFKAAGCSVLKFLNKIEELCGGLFVSL